MHLENTKAGVFINIKGELVDDGPQTSLENRVFLGISERVVEDDKVRSQTILIHLTDTGKTAHSEEEHCATTGHWSV